MKKERKREKKEKKERKKERKKSRNRIESRFSTGVVSSIPTEKFETRTETFSKNLPWNENRKVGELKRNREVAWRVSAKSCNVSDWIRSLRVSKY